MTLTKVTAKTDPPEPTRLVEVAYTFDLEPCMCMRKERVDTEKGV
jgi:hypothetical protein